MKSLFCLLFLSAAPAFAQAKLIVNIDSPNFRKLVVAVPDIATPAGADPELQSLAAEASAELTRLLTFCGLFNVMDAAGYKDLAKNIKGGGSLAGLDGIELPAWKTIGVESLTVGEISRDGKDLQIALRTADIYQGKLLVGKKYSKVDSKQIKRAMARYADRVLQAYTGKPGIFSSRLVFVGRRVKGATKQIFVSDFDGADAVAITNGKATTLSPSWSRDGRFITYTSFEDGNPDVFIYELATGKRRKLSGRKGIDSGANWSANNKLVAFTASENGDSDIYVIKPDGTGARPLIRGSGLDVDPTFSPNGKWLAFVSGRFGNPHIFVAELKWDGDVVVQATSDKRLTFAGWYNATPAWTPESDKIAFAGFDKEISRFDLFLMNPDGTQLERLTIRTGNNERPSFAPNGQMIVFHSDRVGNRDIKGTPALYVMNRDGSSQRKLETGLFEAQTPQWGPPEE